MARGAGTSASPYLIGSVAELREIESLSVNFNYLSPMFCRQDAHITLSGNWTPVGETPFRALSMDYNGDGYRISGLNQSRELGGVFGSVYGRIRNLQVYGSVSVSASGGGICGTLMAIPFFGGIALENCQFHGSVTGSGTNNMVGGVCKTLGAVSGVTTIYVTNGMVSGGTVSGQYAGGIAGIVLEPAVLNSCVVQSSVTGTYAGGFFGYTGSDTISYAGGASVHKDSVTNTSGFSNLAYDATRKRTPVQLGQQATYTSFDFTNTWVMFEAQTPPWLRLFRAMTTAAVPIPSGGVYTSNPLVALTHESAAFAPCRIFYTVNGAVPAPSIASPLPAGTLMAQAGSTISLTVPATLKTIAWQMYCAPSTQTTGIYAEAERVYAPVVTPPAGAYPGVELDAVVTCATEGATIHYTTNGANPTTGSPTVADGGTLTRPIGSGTLKLLAVKTGLTDSNIVTVVYTAAAQVATPTVSPAGGAYTGATVAVTVRCATPGATIRYILAPSAGGEYQPAEGDEPTEESPVVADGDSVSVPISSVLICKAWADGLNPSDTGGAEYTSKLYAPTFSPPSGSTESATMPVVVTCGSASVAIHYTVDGSTPDATDPTVANGGTITITVPAVLKAVAIRADYADSDVTSGSYSEALATHALPFTRFVRQVRTEPRALLDTPGAAKNALSLLMAARWAAADENASTFPARNALLDGSMLSWDAYKVVGNYAMDDAGIGYQRAYAGAVAYRFRVPADAIANARDVIRVTVPLSVDRWLVDGVRVTAHLSDSSTPSADWAVIRAGDISAQRVLPMTYDPTRSTAANPTGAILIEKSGDIALEFPAASAATRYLYVYISLEDYESVRGLWIEGAARIDGDSTLVEFDQAVAVDPPESQYLGLPTAVFGYLAPDEDTIAGASRYANNVATLTYAYPATGTSLMLSAYLENALVQALPAAWVASSEDTLQALYTTVDGSPKTVKVASGLLPLLVGVVKAGALSEIIIHSEIPAHPEWMQVRLNVYAIFGPDAAQKEASAARVAMIAAGPSWWNGQHNADGFVNLVSAELSPYGYSAYSTWPVAGVSIPAGLCALYISTQITGLTAAPDEADGTPYGLDFAITAITLKL